MTWMIDSCRAASAPPDAAYGPDGCEPHGRCVEPRSGRRAGFARRAGGRLMAGLAFLLAAHAAARAQAAAEAPYPNRPVRLVVSYAAGNVTDALARVLADRLAERWGVAVTVDNRPGQGGSMGAQIAAKAVPDGYTLLFSAMAAMAIDPHVYANVGYDPARDFLPIVNVASPTSVLVAAPALKIDNLADLVAYGKAHPSALNYGTAGNGTVPHLNMEALKARTGLVAQHVPYKSAGAVLTDVIGGRIQLQQESVSVVLPQIRAGKLVPIAAGSAGRLAQLTDLPSLTELVPGYTPVVPWLGLFAPAGTPPAVRDKVFEAVSAVLRQPDIRDKLQSLGLQVAGDSSDAFGRLMVSDYQRMGILVKQLGLKAD